MEAIERRSGRRVVPLLLEEPPGLAGGLGGVRPVSEPVDDENGHAAPRGPARPGVAADLLARLRHRQTRDAERAGEDAIAV